MSTRVLRYEVPVDDDWHRFNLDGPVVYVNSRRADRVEFWALTSVLPAHTTVAFRVYGTGHDVEPLAEYVGSAIVADGALVWHLFKMEGTAP